MVIIMSIAFLHPTAHFPKYTTIQPMTFQRSDRLPLGPEFLWRIESGFVRTLTWNDQGEVATVGIWGPDDMVGKPFSRLHPYQIECLTVVQAVRTSIQDAAVYPALLSHVQHSETLLSLMHGKQICDRLIQLLAWLGQRFGTQTEQGWVVELKLTHQVISELLGTTRVTVTRLLNLLEEQGRLIRFRQGYVLVNKK